MQGNNPHAILAELIQASSQDDSLVQFRTPVSAHQYLKLYELANRYIRSGSTVLDWGAGNGHFSYFLVKAGHTVSGFDFGSPPKVSKTLTPESYTYKRGNPDNPVSLPYKSQTFDAVVSVGVLEHVRETGGNESANLNEIYRILKPKGIFLCYHLPNRYSWIEAVLRLIGRWSHQYRYTSSNIISLASSAGFEVVEVQRYAILPRNIWGRGILKKVSSSCKIARLYNRIDDFLSTVITNLPKLSLCGPEVSPEHTEQPQFVETIWKSITKV